MRLFSMVEEKGKKILIIIIVLTISVVGAYYFIKLRKDSFKVIEKNDKVIKEEKEVKEEKKEEEKEEESISWIVDVKGEVVNPGIHKIEKDMRINDQTTPNMIQRISGIFERKPLISKEI